MSTPDHASRTQIVTGVLLTACIGTADGIDCTRVTLGVEGRRLNALAFDHDAVWLGRYLSPLVAETFDLLHTPGLIPPIITRIGPAQSSGLLRHLPADLCPLDGALSALRKLVGSIQSTPLRDFVEGVFARRDVHDAFWTLPASIAHHHSYPGGLAIHSLEVASDMASQSALTRVERDLGIAAALLHDIGKVWSYDGRRLTRAAQAMGHELLGMSRLEGALSALEAVWEDGAHAMRVMLSGQVRRRSDGSCPYALVQRLRACDQRSAERARHTGASRVGRAWAPARCRLEPDVTSSAADQSYSVRMPDANVNVFK